MVPAEQQNSEVIKSLADSIRRKLVHPAEARLQDLDAKVGQLDQRLSTALAGARDEISRLTGSLQQEKNYRAGLQSRILVLLAWNILLTAACGLLLLRLT
ncbi:MAG: hypothetical protein AB1815_00840 [Bacillota bacterium]|jgi:hypothetical protein